MSPHTAQLRELMDRITRGETDAELDLHVALDRQLRRMIRRALNGDRTAFFLTRYIDEEVSKLDCDLYPGDREELVIVISQRICSRIIQRLRSSPGSGDTVLGS